MHITFAELEKEMRGLRDEIVGLTCELIGARSVNPPGDEWRAAAVVEKFFRRHGIAFSRHEKQKGRTNLIARIGSTGPRIALAAHLDTVAAGDGWKTKPFEPLVAGDRIYGRGSADNKGQAACLMLLCALLFRHVRRLPCTLVAIFCADEEAGSALGLEYLLHEKLVAADFAVIPDIGGNMREISIAEKGYLDLKIEALGRQAHSSTPELGVNAIDKLAELLTLLKRHRFRQKKHPLLSPMNVSVSTIRGGVAANMVPAHAEATVNIRFVPGQTPAGIVREVRALAKKVKGGKFKIAAGTNMAPSEVATDHPILRKLRAAALRGARFTGMSGTTVCKQLIRAGIPSVGFSCGDGRLFHQANEFISITQQERFVRTLARFMLSL